MLLEVHRMARPSGEEVLHVMRPGGWHGHASDSVDN